MMYEVWRITYQDAEQAARAAYRSAQEHLEARETAEAELLRLRAEIKGIRNRIGDSPMSTAGSTAVHLLERVLRGQAL